MEMFQRKYYKIMEGEIIIKKYGKYIISLIAVTCIIAIAFVYNLFYDKSQETIAPLNNTVSNALTEKINHNEVTNTTVEQANTVDETEISVEPKTNVIEKKNTTVSTVYEQDNDVGSTDKKQEAINLVKQKWGEDNSVTFRCDTVTNSGEYIIVAVSKNSASVKNYFRVNLEEQTVIVDD